VIILDTNVISEMMRVTPSPEVAAWFARAAPSSLFTTSLTQAEVLCGIALLSAGRKRDDLMGAAHAMFARDMTGRVLPFDSEAAIHFSDIAASRRHAGRPISQIDAQIAAITRARGASLATRNVDDFADCGVVVIDPWKE
jgi:predicted nucleic acid-binding protein